MKRTHFFLVEENLLAEGRKVARRGSNGLLPGSGNNSVFIIKYKSPWNTNLWIIWKVLDSLFTLCHCINLTCFPTFNVGIKPLFYILLVLFGLFNGEKEGQRFFWSNKSLSIKEECANGFILLGKHVSKEDNSWWKV